MAIPNTAPTDPVNPQTPEPVTEPVTDSEAPASPAPVYPELGSTDTDAVKTEAAPTEPVVPEPEPVKSEPAPVTLDLDKENTEPEVKTDLELNTEESVPATPDLSAVDPNSALKENNHNVIEGQTDPDVIQKEEIEVPDVSAAPGAPAVEPIKTGIESEEAPKLAEEKPVAPPPTEMPTEPMTEEAHKTVSSDQLIPPELPVDNTVESKTEVGQEDKKSDEVPKAGSTSAAMKFILLFLVIAVLAASGVLVYLMFLA